MIVWKLNLWKRSIILRFQKIFNKKSIYGSLLLPVKLGYLSLSCRIIMVGRNCGRTGSTRIPNNMMVKKYGRAAPGRLDITEVAIISKQGYGWHGFAGIYDDAQEAAWKRVTDAVHKDDGRIFLQLTHMGRLSHPDLQEGGTLPVAPSAIRAEGQTRTATGMKDYVVPRALNKEELPGIIEDYVLATRRALRAGFDGIEIDCANGFLLDQFLRDGTNQRIDTYGGSIENRLRFPLEVVRAVVAEASAGRTGIRISPTDPNGGTKDSNPEKTFAAYAKALNKFNLAFLHVFEPPPESRAAFPGAPVTPTVRRAYNGNLIIDGSFMYCDYSAIIDSGLAQAIAFNRRVPAYYDETGWPVSPDKKSQ